MIAGRPAVAAVLRVAVVLAALLAVSRPVGAAAESRVIDLAIRNGAVPADQRLIKVNQGDDVTIRWTSDKPATVHLHGYDIEKAITPAAPVTMRFTARATGRFQIELHGSKPGQESVLGYLEVHPR
jgi:FtsP/CotA-like multicopper oxidase with cupredoxin domain